MIKLRKNVIDWPQLNGRPGLQSKSSSKANFLSRIPIAMNSLGILVHMCLWRCQGIRAQRMPVFFSFYMVLVFIVSKPFAAGPIPANVCFC